MLVVPVIDVRGGVAVAAVRGERALYRPLASPLAPSADPVAVALGLRALFPFATLYVADLDGIEGRGPDRAAQQRLADAWPGAELWIDAGRAGADRPGPPSPPLQEGREREARPSGSTGLLSPWGDGLGEEAQRERRPLPPIATPVIGSESLASLDDYRRARAAAGPAAPLSLDFRGEAFLGPRALLDDAALWPARVIVMTLARVGSGEGPDLARLRSIIARAGGRSLYAAGGVRHAADLRALRDIGAAGALVATALHAGRITAADLRELGGGGPGA